MFVADSLYGGTTLPGWISSLLLTPEVQRLRGIRLINSSSPSLAALSDARRYTHTLGVVHLALVSLESQTATKGDARALICAAICHDLGTPPFGHLFEYLLSAMAGWSHEYVVRSILDATYRREGPYHQITPGHQLGLGKALRDLDIEPATVAGLARGEGVLGPLVAGSIDLDNVDNVYRMAHLLGLPSDGRQSAMRLAASLHVRGGRLAVTRESLGLLASWATIRRRVYEVLAFDETNLKGQSMLTDCLTTAMAEGQIGPEDWFWTDEWLLYKLATFDGTKDIVQRFIAGDLYETVYVGWYKTGKGAVDWRHPVRRAELQKELEAQLKMPCSPYVFYDNGTFSKQLDVDVIGGGDVNEILGTKRSHSAIVAVFTPRRKVPPGSSAASRDVLDGIGFPAISLQRVPDKASIYGLPGQAALPL
jgi:HD superfamily phosphohydrolase